MDSLQSQIREGCRLALPEGLKELMSDISREVLRYQPENLYQFIADYLEALLNARDTLSIACRICGEVSSCACQPQLDDELSRIGLSQDDAATAKNIILDHFDKGQVQESNLLIKLAAKTNVTEEQLVELQQAIQRAFQRYIKRKDLRVSFAMFGDDNTDSTVEKTSSVSQQSSASDFYKPSFFPDAISGLHDAQVKQSYSSSTYLPYNASVSAATLAGSYVSLPEKTPYSVHNSECNNMLVKSEKSVLNLLRSFLFAESRQHRGAQVYQNINIDTFNSLTSNETQNTDSEEIDDAIKSVFSHDIHEVRSRNSKDSQSLSIFTAIQENSYESSSEGL